MSTLLRPILRNAVGSAISLTADVTTKIAITLTLACTLALITMECMGLIGKFFGLVLAYGPRVDIFLTILVIFQWSKGDFIENQLERLLKYRAPPPLIIIGFLLLAIISLLVISSLIAWLSPIFTPKLSMTLNFTPQDWPIIWAIFSGIWWLSWAPLTAAMLAYVWRGYKIHTLIVCTLLLPITAGIFEYLYPNWRLNSGLNTSLWNLLPALLSAGIIIWLFLRTWIITYAWKATLPTANWYDYQRSPKTFLKRLLQGVIIMMGLYWVGGMYVPGLIYFAAMFPIGVFVSIAGIAVFVTFFANGVDKKLSK